MAKQHGRDLDSALIFGADLENDACRWNAIAMSAAAARSPRTSDAPLRRSGTYAVALVPHESFGIAPLEALLPRWRSLWSRCSSVGGASRFTSPDWILAHALDDERTWTVTVTRGAALVAIAPLVTSRIGGRRVVTLVGADAADRSDALVDPELGGDEAADQLLDAIAAARVRWDLCELAPLDEAAALARAELSDAAAANVRDARRYAWSATGRPVLVRSLRKAS